MYPPPPPAPPAPPLPLEAVENAGVDRAANEVSVTNHEPAAKPHFVCSPQKRPPLPPAINNMSAAIKARGGGGGGWREAMETAGGASDEFFPLDMFAVFWRRIWWQN